MLESPFGGFNVPNMSSGAENIEQLKAFAEIVKQFMPLVRKFVKENKSIVADLVGCLLDVGVDVAKENDKYAEQFAQYRARTAKVMLTALMHEGFSRKEALQLILARMGQQSSTTEGFVKGAGALNGALSRNKPSQ